ncbi:hypothetical protein Pyn_25702 [Prunus yedoensis var. nudiflora]|uniref:Uncharacterized protein n=1 Tax=Prunus yedoensis var. nudiflora TaxID=2094558 RepID=A0A314YWP8_PRUYE|nr:hypothetical protein Pyn_25702 [Prunus yedoensis var. nudiflora]
MPSSSSTFTSSFFSPVRSALNTWAAVVSLQSILVFRNTEFSQESTGDVENGEEDGNGKSLNGSQRSTENGSK